ncbi:MAG: NAD(P)-dependent oxidoreductase [Acidimicrobiaceae bacterium]|nr:NAD(P)-dependent oxidoreductase [Acidimicrobiaceae bacterium]
MRVFVAGGTGAIGHYLVPQLVAAGHDVRATTRSRNKSALIRSWGAKPVVVDGLDRDHLIEAVQVVRPDVLIHEMTAIDPGGTLRHFDAEFAVTNQLRTLGTDNLLAAARKAGVGRVIAQSFTGWTNAVDGAGPKTEDDPLDPDPPQSMRESLAAIAYLERTVTGATDLDGLALRYGMFYGPGFAPLADAVRRRKLPVVGNGEGVWSFIHLADAASATVAALERGGPGLYNVVDDEPAPVSVWLPYLAEAVGAKPPMHLPAWAGKMAAGEAVVSMMTRIKGSSNAKAKRALGWQPSYASWREGFRVGLEDPTDRPAA